LKTEAKYVGGQVHVIPFDGNGTIILEKLKNESFDKLSYTSKVGISSLQKKKTSFQPIKDETAGKYISSNK